MQRSATHGRHSRAAANMGIQPALRVLVFGITMLVGCSDGPGAPDGPSLSLVGRWGFTWKQLVAGISIVTTTMELELTQQGTTITGTRRHGLRVTVVSTGIGPIETTTVLPDVPVTGRVTGDRVSIVLDLDGDGEAITLNASAAVDRIYGDDGWQAWRWIGIPITDARARLGDTVTVSGVITLGQAELRIQHDLSYIQDRSSGIEVFGLAPGLSLIQGDSVAISGRIGRFSGELQLVARDAGGLVVRRLGRGTVPSPIFLGTSVASWSQYEGMLVESPLMGVAGIDSGLASGAYAVRVATSNGSSPLVVVGGALTPTLPYSTWLRTSANYVVTGVLGKSGTTPQVQPRSRADVQCFGLHC
jgi:hypothetical protein